MSNSNLVNYTKLSPNCTKPRKNKITKIVIHHMAGNLTVEACGNVFANTSRQASSNYGIGTSYWSDFSHKGRSPAIFAF